jgi:hypothetical protein
MELLKEQRENDRMRYEALRRTSPVLQPAVARPFEVRARELIERRYDLETRAIGARYAARNDTGSPRCMAEMERADHRRTGALRRLEQRERTRELRALGIHQGRTGALRERGTPGQTRSVESAARRATDQTMKELGLPWPARAEAQLALALGAEALLSLQRALAQHPSQAREGSAPGPQPAGALGAAPIPWNLGPAPAHSRYPLPSPAPEVDR